MKRNHIVIALSVAFVFGCAHKETQKTYAYNHLPFDFVGESPSKGRIPAQSGGAGLIKFMETVGESQSVRTIEYLNTTGRGTYGLTRNITKLDELSPSQRIAVLDDLSRVSSPLAKYLNLSKEASESAFSYMKQMKSPTVQQRVGINVQGVSGKDLPHTGWGPAADIGIYELKSLGNGTLVSEVTVLSKNLKKVAAPPTGTSLARPVLNKYAGRWVDAEIVTIKATGGKRLLSSKLCEGNTVQFSESVVPTVTDTLITAADDIAKESQLAKLSEADMAAITVRAHKKSVPGASCIRSAQAVRALSTGGGGNGGCPLFSDDIARGLASIDDFAAVCK